jgi:thiol-disulfide isomerase/thioredoxin
MSSSTTPGLLRARRSAVLTALLLVTAVGCSVGRSSSPATGTGGNGYVGAAASFTLVAPADRKPAPVAEGRQLGAGDRTISTGDYPGKVIVLNVWGSWCGPCRQEAPALQGASVATRKVAQFVGINSRDPDPGPPEAFVRVRSITYPSIYDPDGKVLVAFAGNLPLVQIPSTLVIDRQGRVAARIVGTISKTSLVGLVNDIAAGK